MVFLLSGCGWIAAGWKDYLKWIFGLVWLSTAFSLTRSGAKAPAHPPGKLWDDFCDIPGTSAAASGSQGKGGLVGSSWKFLY